MQVPFSNSLRFKIGFSYIFLMAINMGVTIWTIYNFGRLTNALTEILSKNYPNTITVENMARSVERHDKAVRFFLNGDINNGKIELTIAKDEFYQYFDAAKEQISNELNQAILEDIQSTHTGYLMLIDSLQIIIEEGKFTRARQFHYDDLLPFYQRLSDNCFWLVEENQKSMTAVSTRTKEIANDSVIAILTASLIALVVSILIIIQFTKRIILPAEKLAETVNQIGRGRLDLKIDVQTTDEFGLLSREFNKMTERLRKFEAMNIDKILLEKQKSETIVTSLSDAMIVCDANGTIQHINESAEQLFGRKQENLVGHLAKELTSDKILSSIFFEQERSSFINQPFVEFQKNGKTVYLRPRISYISSRYNEREGT
ncbi:MAG: HAMP domain-containing protein, partial [Ignavibacteriae bacterium]|nr:HAMP domain-containing protein [Ignavibacteriota bacterium]